MMIKFFPNDKGNPVGKLADAEIHFTDGPLSGLKLLGFAVWERKNGGRNLTMPSRQYSVNGERRSFALLRPRADAGAQDKIRDVILDAYRAFEEAQRDADATPSEAVPVPADLTSPYSGEWRAAHIEARRTGKAVRTTDGGSIDPDGFRWAPDTTPAPPVSLPPAPFTLQGNDARPF